MKVNEAPSTSQAAAERQPLLGEQERRASFVAYESFSSPDGTATLPPKKRAWKLLILASFGFFIGGGGVLIASALDAESKGEWSPSNGRGAVIGGLITLVGAYALAFGTKEGVSQCCKKRRAQKEAVQV